MPGNTRRQARLEDVQSTPLGSVRADIATQTHAVLQNVEYALILVGLEGGHCDRSRVRAAVVERIDQALQVIDSAAGSGLVPRAALLVSVAEAGEMASSSGIGAGIRIPAAAVGVCVLQAQ